LDRTAETVKLFQFESWFILFRPIWVRRTYLLLATVHCLLCTFLRTHAAEPTNNFTQTNFVIGLWNSPERGDLDKAYKGIADANFNLVVATAATNAIGQLKLCEKYGLQALISASVNDPIPDSPACMGYYLVDEPAADSFPGLAKLVEEIRQKKPGKFGYINLYPNYAPAYTFGGPTYDDYIAGFIKIVKPEVLSMDHYPAMRPHVDTRPSYRANLETCRVQSLKAGIPFWNYFYSMPFNDRLDPTEAQLRWQMFTSIAYGAKGVLYFCYWTPRGPGFEKGGAVVTAEGLPTRHYDEARRINAEIKNWGPTLMKLKSTGAYDVSTTNATAIPSASGLTNLTGIAGDPAANYLVGTFESPEKSRAIIIVNDDYSFTGWLTLSFDVDAAKVQEVSKYTGQLAPVVDDSPELKGLQISFGAGDARFFVLLGK
jgi:hypothetical protein